MAQLYDSLTGYDGHCIRLVHLDGEGLHAGSGAINCSLQTVTLQEAPAYWALSYCWGDPIDPPFITCNGLDIPVTANLHDALRQLAKRGHSLPLWIDAICINQADPLEKASQVKMMGEVYRNAQKVVIWLGPAVDDGATEQLAIELCREFSTHKAPEPTLAPGHEKDEGDKPDITDRLPEFNALSNILARPWWKRIWVVQELALARDAQVLCGDSVIDWDVFSQGLVNFIGVLDPHHVDFPPRYLHHARALFELRAEFGERGSLARVESRRRLVTLLHQFRLSHATDPRDKVYALLGLAGHGPGQPNIDVKYTGDPNDARQITTCYTEAAFEVIKASRSLDILQLCGGPHEPKGSPRELDTLPSWAPDLSFDTSSLPTSVVEPFLFEYHSVRARFHLVDEAGKSSGLQGVGVSAATKGSQADKVLMVASGALMLQGFVWDTVTTVGVQAPDNFGLLRSLLERRLVPLMMGTPPLSKLSKALRFGTQIIWDFLVGLGSNLRDILEWKRIAFAQPNYPTGETNPDVFHALIHDDYLNNEPAYNVERDKSACFKLLKVLGRAEMLFPSVTSGHSQRLRNGGLGLVATVLSIPWRGLKSIMNNVPSTRIARTAKGYLARVPLQTRDGDQIALLRGGSVPFVVREIRNGGVSGDDHSRFQLVGGCYVHGIMYGEQWDDSLSHKILLI